VNISKNEKYLILTCTSQITVNLVESYEEIFTLSLPDEPNAHKSKEVLSPDASNKPPRDVLAAIDSGGKHLAVLSSFEDAITDELQIFEIS